MLFWPLEPFGMSNFICPKRDMRGSVVRLMVSTVQTNWLSFPVWSGKNVSHHSGFIISRYVVKRLQPSEPCPKCPMQSMKLSNGRGPPTETETSFTRHLQWIQSGHLRSLIVLFLTLKRGPRWVQAQEWTFRQDAEKSNSEARKWSRTLVELGRNNYNFRAAK